MNDWLWRNYRYLQFKDAEGRKLYQANFILQSIDGFELQHRIRFWANKPKQALEAICRSGKQPLDFHDSVVN
jgi:hypothetical protein